MILINNDFSSVRVEYIRIVFHLVCHGRIYKNCIIQIGIAGCDPKMGKGATSLMMAEKYRGLMYT